MSDITAIRDRARFVAPRPGVHIVTRTRLDDRYRAATGRIVRVMAPPGYGKSTLVSRWVADDDRTVRWLDLERVDNDPVVLMGAFARGLSDLVDDPSYLVPEYSVHDRRFNDLAIPAFGAAIGRICEPFVLVVDDTHQVTEPVAWELLDAVARNVPAASTVVFVGRGAEDRLSMAAMRLDPGIVDVSTSDLALDVAETEQLLIAYGVELGLDEVADLADRFEGWAAGLRLASLVLATKDGRELFDSATAGELVYVTDYLRSEWLLTLSADDRQFLMEAACLRTFNADMCDEALGRVGSAEIMRRLEHRQLVVLPLDRRGSWYRMHGLLRDWLETELRHADRARWQEVHRDAALWWERCGDIDLAVQHLEWSGESTRRQALVIAHGAGHIMRGMTSTVRRWLAGFSIDEVSASLGLCVVAAGVEMASGDGSSGLRWVRLISESPWSETNDIGTPVWSHWADVIRASTEAGPASPLLERAERARSNISVGAWHVYGSLVVGGLRALVGAPDAVDVLLGGAHEADIVGAHLQRAMCLSFAAILLDLDGDRDAALPHAVEAHRLLRDLSLDHAPTASSTAAMWALISARAGRCSDAVACLDRCDASLAGFTEVSPWFNVLTRTAMAQAALLVDDPARAAKLLREIDHHLRFEAGDVGMRPHVDTLRAQVDAARLISAERSWSLSTAELRVLQLLPTNLSLADIATRLFISRNTVKSHTSSIYRKLGTTSRSRAVELARGAGLLSAPASSD